MKDKKNVFLGLLIAASLLLTIGCDLTGSDNGGNGGGGSTPTVTYAIGDTGPSGVGIVFYVTDGGLHGLEVAPNDQSTSVDWNNIPDEDIGTTDTAIDAGSANTDAIIGQSGHTASAAQICRDYRASEEGDWFLPSKDELNAIWDNLVNDGSDANNGIGGFAEEYYWSSSEGDPGDVWVQDFDDGRQGNGSKDFSRRVRAVRAF